MKKILALVLASCMVLALGVTAFVYMSKTEEIAERPVRLERDDRADDVKKGS